MKKKPIRKALRIQVNDACICGSDKKYKKCCGQQRQKPKRTRSSRPALQHVDMRQFISTDLQAATMRLLLDRGVNPRLVFLFSRFGTTFSSYSLALAGAATEAAVVAALTEWAALGEVGQQELIEQWRRTNDSTN